MGIKMCPLVLLLLVAGQAAGYAAEAPKVSASTGGLNLLLKKPSSQEPKKQVAEVVKVQDDPLSSKHVISLATTQSVDFNVPDDTLDISTDRIHLHQPQPKNVTPAPSPSPAVVVEQRGSLLIEDKAGKPKKGTTASPPPKPSPPAAKADTPHPPAKEAPTPTPIPSPAPAAVAEESKSLLMQSKPKNGTKAPPPPTPSPAAAAKVQSKLDMEEKGEQQQQQQGGGLVSEQAAKQKAATLVVPSPSPAPADGRHSNLFDEANKDALKNVVSTVEERPADSLKASASDAKKEKVEKKVEEKKEEKKVEEKVEKKVEEKKEKKDEPDAHIAFPKADESRLPDTEEGASTRSGHSLAIPNSNEYRPWEHDGIASLGGCETGAREKLYSCYAQFAQENGSPAAIKQRIFASCGVNVRLERSESSSDEPNDLKDVTFNAEEGCAELEGDDQKRCLINAQIAYDKCVVIKKDDLQQAEDYKQTYIARRDLCKQNATLLLPECRAKETIFQAKVANKATATIVQDTLGKLCESVAAATNMVSIETEAHRTLGSQPEFNEAMTNAIDCMKSGHAFYKDVALLTIGELLLDWKVFRMELMKRTQLTTELIDQSSCASAEFAAVKALGRFDAKIGMLRTLGHACRQKCVYNGANCTLAPTENKILESAGYSMGEYEDCLRGQVTSDFSAKFKNFYNMDLHVANANGESSQLSKSPGHSDAHPEPIAVVHQKILELPRGSAAPQQVVEKSTVEATAANTAPAVAPQQQASITPKENAEKPVNINEPAAILNRVSAEKNRVAEANAKYQANTMQGMGQRSMWNKYGAINTPVMNLNAMPNNWKQPFGGFGWF